MDDWLSKEEMKKFIRIGVSPKYIELDVNELIKVFGKIHPKDWRDLVSEKFYENDAIFRLNE
jgi:hypothetical protein